jgi:two-component system chemotaxis response regulator CheB
MIRVLVVDDSAVMRAFMSRLVASQPDMELAGIVPDPVLAIERVRASAPDVLTLDVEMPRMNGLDFLRRLMAVRPMPVVMISSLTRQGAEVTLQALELGAVDFFCKPASFRDLEEVGRDIAAKIRAAAKARVGARAFPRAIAPVPSFARPRSGLVIGMGASTGGVEALRCILERLPGDMPPILVAQHMLPGFTETFARRLDSVCSLHVRHASDGEALEPGVVHIAEGGRHLLLAGRPGGYRVRVSDDAPHNRHRPSIDLLFQSLAERAGEHAVGMLLTGMGSDGAQGLLAIRKAGGKTLAQDEATSVVFGMPRQAIAAGAVQQVAPLHLLAARLQDACAAPAAGV